MKWLIDDAYPNAEKIVLVMDNFPTCEFGRLKERTQQNGKEKDQQLFPDHPLGDPPGRVVMGHEMILLSLKG